MRLLLVLSTGLAVVAGAAAALRAPALLTLEGAAGARPGMSVAEVSARWDLRLRPNYEVRPTCGQAIVDERGLQGYAIFTPRDRFGAVFLSKGAVTGRGIRIGSTLTQLRRAYPKLTSRPDRYLHGTRNYFLRRVRAPHWHLRFDVSPRKRVTQIVFGDQRVRAPRRGLRLALGPERVARPLYP